MAKKRRKTLMEKFEANEAKSKKIEDDEYNKDKAKRVKAQKPTFRKATQRVLDSMEESQKIVNESLSGSYVKGLESSESGWPNEERIGELKKKAIAKKLKKGKKSSKVDWSFLD